LDDLALILFDVDGTLVDSQSEILAAMQDAFAAIAQPVPNRDAILSTVGLSLEQAMIQLLSLDNDARTMSAAVSAYKHSYRKSREAGTMSVLYPGIADLLRNCRMHENWLLGLATGKSRRGVNALVDYYDWGGVFQTIQTADTHPSKPNPAMLQAALAETGVSAQRCVCIGDTTHDMRMAVAAKVGFVGVSWGYHPVDRFDAAFRVAETPQSVYQAITDWLERDT
jgi:phosphoglycolate phosphatase